MGSDGVSEIDAGAGERMVGWTSLTLGSSAGPGTCKGGRCDGAETFVHNELVEVGRFFQGNKGGFGKEVLG